MDSTETAFTRYKIEMKICEPENMSENKNWYSHDTSAINFTSLKPGDIKCGEYFDMEKPAGIAGKENEITNQFEFGNQVFAWEKIFVFKISNMSSRAWHPEMYIVMPMKYKSFRTHIEITDIKFLPGKVIFLNELNAAYKESVLNVLQSLKYETGVTAEHSQPKSLLEE